jgi:nicotinamidase-related amidase
MPDMTFGPPGKEWHYSTGSRTYDLSKGSEKKLTFHTTEGPKLTSIAISPESSALVVIDMQNFFLDPRCRDHPNGLKAVEPTIKVIEKCREVGIQVHQNSHCLPLPLEVENTRLAIQCLPHSQVIWLNWGLTDEDMKTMPAGVQRGFLRSVLQPESTPLRSYAGLGSELGDSKGRCLFAGYWNTELYPPLKEQVKPDDIHCAKNRMSGLWNSDQPLWKALRAEKKNTLIFTGVNTDQCVQGTMVDAYNVGWNCILVDDCCGTTTPGAKEVVFHNIVVSCQLTD